MGTDPQHHAVAAGLPRARHGRAHPQGDLSDDRVQLGFVHAHWIRSSRCTTPAAALESTLYAHIRTLLLALCLSSTAQAADVWVSSAAFTDRARAEGHARQLRAQGHSAEMRRSQTLGEGERWFVRVRSDDLESGHGLAAVLTALTSLPHSVRAARPQPGVVAAVAPNPSTRARIQASAEVRFTYIRTLADGRSLRHQYVRLPGATQIDISTLAGEPHLSLRVEPEVAMFAGPEGTWRSADLYRARQMVADLGPAEVLRPVWARPEEGVHVELTGEVLDAVVALPRTLEVRRGDEVLDRVEVLELDLDPPRPVQPSADAGT